MKVKNHSHPHKTQMDGFFEGDTETPIAMLNLLKFKEKAQALANLLKHLETIKKTNITTSLLNEITIDNKNILREINNINKKI